MIRSFITLMTFAILTLITVGCSDGEQLQLDVQKALTKQTEMNNYRFSGSADLKLEHTAAAMSTNPLTASLLTMFTNGKLTWEGVASVEPVRMELSLKLTPHATNQSIDIPMLIQDNKMYVHIPAINEENQYYEINLDELSELSGMDNSLSAAQLGSTGQFISSSFNHIIGAIHPKRFEDTTSKDVDLRTISITLKQKHVEEAIDVWFTALPHIINQLSDIGYIQPKTLEAWDEKLNEDKHQSWIKRSDDITLNDPLALIMKLDDEGFVRESQLKANITTIDSNKLSSTSIVNIINRYDDINQNPAFTQPVPTNIKSFTDILKFMSAQ